MSYHEGPDLEQVAMSICKAHGYTLMEYLGQGAFKRAFRAEDGRGNDYALKVIAGEASSPRTEREAEAIARCDHPNIARLIRLGTQLFEDRNYDFIVEEFVGGGTLADRLRVDGSLDDDQATALGDILIDALVHLAQLSLVHRDIKPENVMYRAGAGGPVLVDFGLVRDLSASSLTPSHAMRGPGTPYFAAPEQLNNDKHLIDWRTDQFSLGVLLFFARFGAHPYQHAPEPPFSEVTVDRVAERGPRADHFHTSLRHSPLATIERMTRPWPVARFRRPTELADAWGVQEESD